MITTILMGVIYLRTSEPPPPDSPPKASAALTLLFRNLDDRIRGDTCDDDKRVYGGKPVLTLLADRLGATIPPETDRKFSVICEDAQVLVKRSYVESWACTFMIERTKENTDGGPLIFYLTRDGKRYIRDRLFCHERSDPPAAPEKSPPKPGGSP